jgi:hypothetical protein
MVSEPTEEEKQLAEQAKEYGKMRQQNVLGEEKGAESEEPPPPGKTTPYPFIVSINLHVPLLVCVTFLQVWRLSRRRKVLVRRAQGQLLSPRLASRWRGRNQRVELQQPLLQIPAHFISPALCTSATFPPKSRPMTSLQYAAPFLAT